jgi:putative Mg2+ transporter-C (MgtC) family protein
VEAYLETGSRLLMAAVLGGLIGLERESMNRPAGLRTHLLVCTGAALIMMVSLNVYGLYKGETNADPARIAAQVVSGIGFLGAGTILREGITVRGLTTAASLWVVAGVGLAVGAGFFLEAVMTATIVLLALVFLGKVDRLLLARRRVRRLTVTARDEPGLLGQLGSALGTQSVNIVDVHIQQLDKNLVLIHFDVQYPINLPPERLAETLYNVPGVLEIKRG